MKKNKGLAQIPLIIGLIVVAVAIPVVKNFSLKKKPVEEMPKQETVKKEKKVEAKMFLEPKEINLKVGEKKKIKVIVDTSEGKRKVDIARAVLCWNGGLTIGDVEKDIILDTAFFDGFVFKNPVKVEGLDCIDIVANSQKRTNELNSGKMTLAEIIFTGTEKVEGGVFSFDSFLSEVSGPANEKGDYGIQLGEFEKFIYQVK